LFPHPRSVGLGVDYLQAHLDWWAAMLMNETMHHRKTIRLESAIGFVQIRIEDVAVRT